MVEALLKAQLRKKVGLGVRRQSQFGDLSPKLLQPQRQPAALEASVAGEQHTAPHPEGRIGSAERGDNPPRSAPEFPGSLTLLPEILQQSFVPQGIHRLPEALVVVSGEVAALSESLQRLLLPGALVAVHQINHRWVEHEKDAVDPAAVALGLFFKRENPAPLKRQRAETPRRLNGREGGAAALPVMEIDQGMEIHIGNAIVIGKNRRFDRRYAPAPAAACRR